MKDFDFFIYRWIFNGRRLQAVTQAFIVQHDATIRSKGWPNQ